MPEEWRSCGALLVDGLGDFWSIFRKFSRVLLHLSRELTSQQVVLSLAELASSAPTAGGQYHWISEYAPIRWQRVLSYCSGWLSMVSWQSMVVIECYAISDIIQALILVNDPTYITTGWRGTLLTMGAASVGSVFNIVLASHLSWVEGIFATFHFFAFVPVLVALLIIAPKRSAADVFLQFEHSSGGWSTTSIALFVGQVSNLFVMLGSDGVAHLAEEIEDAGYVSCVSQLNVSLTPVQYVQDHE